MPGQGGAGVRVQAVPLGQHGQLAGGDVLELADPGGHQVVDHAHGAVHAAVQEALDDQHAVVQVAVELDLLLVREHVVGEAGVVRGRVLQPAQRPGGGDLDRDGAGLAQA